MPSRQTASLLICLLIPVHLSLAQPPAQQPGPQDALPPVQVQFEPLLTAWGNVLTARDVTVTMRDGTGISVDIYRPADDDTYSTLYAAGPFPHTADILSDTTTEAGPLAFYVSQGYAVVVASVRGTGLSEGQFTFFARDEQQDHYEIVEWIAGQPWSDGQVAGTGAGYYAASQWLMAIQDPPHLACIAPINGVLDPFRDWIAPGGLANDAIITQWYDHDIRLANAYAPIAPRLVDYDLRLAQLANPTWNDYWQLRSSLPSVSLISVPVFALNDWNQARTAPGIGPTIRALTRLNASNKILISNPPSDEPLYQDTAFLARELMPYYRWCFNGRNTASPYIELPRYRYQVRGLNQVKRDSTWPPGNIAHQAWFIEPARDEAGTDGMLTIDQPSGGGFTTLERQADDAVLRYTSAPLQQPLEIAGPLMFELYVSSSANDLALEVSLSEQVVIPGFTTEPATSIQPGFLDFNDTPDPAAQAPPKPATRLPVSRGVLKASARTTDPALGSTYNPVYSLEEPALLTPGQVYRLDIALRQTAYRFSAGNRLVLEIKPVNDGSLPRTTASDMVHHSAQNPSRLWLPAVRAPLTSQGTTNQTPAAVDFNQPVPEFEVLDEETLNSIGGDPDNPVIFVPE